MSSSFSTAVFPMGLCRENFSQRDQDLSFYSNLILALSRGDSFEEMICSIIKTASGVGQKSTVI